MMSVIAKIIENIHFAIEKNWLLNFAEILKIYRAKVALCFLGAKGHSEQHFFLYSGGIGDSFKSLCWCSQPSVLMELVAATKQNCTPLRKWWWEY